MYEGENKVYRFNNGTGDIVYTNNEEEPTPLEYKAKFGRRCVEYHKPNHLNRGRWTSQNCKSICPVLCLSDREFGFRLVLLF